MFTPIVAQVRAHSAVTPDRTALVAGGRLTSYADLWRDVEHAAAALTSAGVARGDRVVLAATAGDARFASFYLAAHLLGAVAVPVDPKAPAERIAWTAAVARASVVLGVAQSAAGVPAYEDFLVSTSGSAAAMVSLEPEQLADILFTSGTTGRPKGVGLSHRAISAAARNINRFVGTREDDVEVVTLPLSHSFGLGRMRCVLAAGGTLVLVDGLVFPGLAFKAVESSRATALAAVPSGIEILLRVGRDRLARYADQLRYVEIGSAPMPAETRRALMALLPRTRLCMHYGLTEASRAAFTEFHADADCLDSIGRASPNVELAVVGDASEPAPPGTTGRLLIRGDILASGYWEDGGLATMPLIDGWFDTGDRARYDDEGYFYLDAREKELINVGGRKVSPVEVEVQLMKLPGVADCACIGVPDSSGIGEAVWACIVSNQPIDAATLSEILQKTLERYKVPTRFLRVSEIAKTEAGKVQRLAIRRKVLEQHGFD